MTVFVIFSDRKTTLKKLMVNASKKGWLLDYANSDLPKKADNFEDAEKLIRAYGYWHIERSLGIDLSGPYFNSHYYDLRYGRAEDVLNAD